MQFSFFPTDEPEDKIEEQQIPVSYSPATEVKITEEHYKAMIIMVVKGFKNLTKLPKFSLTYRRCNNVGKKEIKEQGILSAFSQNSDVVPGVYEGGLKVWDCAYDLLDYLSTNSQLLKSGMKVLELGCGAGLPGIFALCKGANVDFQDFVFWIVFDFYILKKMDQRTCIKFCVKNEIKCADAFRMLTVAYGEATLDRSNIYQWYKMFSEGREDVNDEERAGCPSTSTTDEKINEVEKMILANRRITVREVAEDLNISIDSCHSIFINDLGMRRVAAKFIPKLLNCDQKQHRMNIANEMLDSVRDNPNLLQRVITGDEAWVYGYDVETKAQSSQWKLPHEPRPKKVRQVRSNLKVLLTVFFDCRNVDVLRVSTIPNILLNTKSEEWPDLPQRCSFIAGDWGAVADFLEAQQARYDLILTSETIYSLPSQPRLIQAMERLLHPAGKV
ncbi:hypothetical protein LAZ67_6003662 [Cordylochernes scorpioides]|uniref:Mos1 transposase HTH domain-containing protein n=1 Tax=Cordylochernes scorpioides TaxID=51811 RepID=A0ABY6KLT9_9ARAC|nr:hypothetical protein LAZ67_6003662 [Cordylochernes scorpioides]